MEEIKTLEDLRDFLKASETRMIVYATNNTEWTAAFFELNNTEDHKPMAQSTSEDVADAIRVGCLMVHELRTAHVWKCTCGAVLPINNRFSICDCLDRGDDDY